MYIKFSFQNVIQINGLKWALGHHARVKDGFLFTSLHTVTFTLGCCPILSPGVARRQEHCKCTLGNVGTNTIILQICNLSCVFNIIITWVSEKAACYENVLFQCGSSLWRPTVTLQRGRHLKLTLRSLKVQRKSQPTL